MKKLVFILFLLPSTIFAQKFSVAQTIRGVAPIPAFTSGKPATLIFVKVPLTPNENLTFEPDFGIETMEGKGWFTDCWIKYAHPVDSTGKFKVNAGVNLSFFFQPFQVNGTTTAPITQAVSYTDYLLGFSYKINDRHSFQLDNWYITALELEYGISGVFSSLTYTFHHKFNKNTSMDIYLNPFYINFSNGSRGFLGNEKITFIRDSFFAFGQLIHPITSNTATNWDVGIGFFLK